MKVLLLISCFVALAAASPMDSWRQVKSPLEHPRYRELLSNLYAQQNFNEGPFRGGRIVGGQAAAANQFPYQIYGYYDDSWLCGGSIISQNYVLTVKTDFRQKINS